MTSELFRVLHTEGEEAPQAHLPISLDALDLARFAPRVAAIGHDEIKPGMVYVGRKVASLPGIAASTEDAPPSLWRFGNPFKLDYDTELGRGACLLRYVRHMRRELGRAHALREDIYKLRDHALVCWCGPGKLCHAHILALISECSDKGIDLVGGEPDTVGRAEETGWSPEWDLALGLLESDLSARVLQRHYVFTVGERDPLAPTQPAQIQNVYTGRTAIITRPDYLPVQLVVRRQGARVSTHTLSSVMAHLHRTQRAANISMWSDGQEHGALRLRIAPLDGIWTAKLLIKAHADLNPVQRKLASAVIDFLSKC